MSFRSKGAKIFPKIFANVYESDQEMPQSQTADQRTAPRGTLRHRTQATTTQLKQDALSSSAKLLLI